MVIIDEKMGDLRNLRASNLDKKGRTTKMSRGDIDRAVAAAKPPSQHAKKTPNPGELPLPERRNGRMCPWVDTCVPDKTFLMQIGPSGR